MTWFSKARFIEPNWQRQWRNSRIFKAEPDPDKPRFYMVFDYPIASGALHVGHVRFYVTADVIARFKRMQGFNVFFSLGPHATGIDCIAIYERVGGDPENAIRYGIPIEDSEKLNSLIVAEKYVEKAIVKSLQRLGCLSIFEHRISTIDAPQNRF